MKIEGYRLERVRIMEFDHTTLRIRTPSATDLEGEFEEKLKREKQSYCITCFFRNVWCYAFTVTLCVGVLIVGIVVACVYA